MDYSKLGPAARAARKEWVETRLAALDKEAIYLRGEVKKREKPAGASDCYK